jgi:GMP synthase-like glutamine amidotransferase
MNRVLILQFMDNDGPAYLGTWLARHGIASDVRLATSGGGFPDRIEGYAALALLGGSMSANDDLPYLRTAERLVAQAMQLDKPVLGHCLGGQLMARTLGARVTASPAPEVGWHNMRCVESAAGVEWFGPAVAHDVFHWHYEAFDLPAGARCLGRSDACPNQAFALGPHLGLQFHVEVDVDKVELWLTHHDAEYDQEQVANVTVHDRERIRRDTRRLLADQMRLADRIYARWCERADLISQ